MGVKRWLRIVKIKLNMYMQRELEEFGVGNVELEDALLAEEAILIE